MRHPLSHALYIRKCNWNAAEEKRCITATAPSIHAPHGGNKTKTKCRGASAICCHGRGGLNTVYVSGGLNHDTLRTGLPPFPTAAPKARPRCSNNLRDFKQFLGPPTSFHYITRALGQQTLVGKRSRWQTENNSMLAVACRMFFPGGRLQGFLLPSLFSHFCLLCKNGSNPYLPTLVICDFSSKQDILATFDGFISVPFEWNVDLRDGITALMLIWLSSLYYVGSHFFPCTFLIMRFLKNHKGILLMFT